jgi:threonine dehydratase
MTDAHEPARTWLAAYADRLGVAAPTDEEFEAILELAAVAAHASERVAAPVACWLAGRVGIEPSAAVAVAASVPAGEAR